MEDKKGFEPPSYIIARMLNINKPSVGGALSINIGL
jgi:hypothetical protein